MARPQELRARRDTMDVEAHANRLRDVIWKLEKQLDEVEKRVESQLYDATRKVDSRGELLRECKEMLRHLALSYPKQVFEKDIGILLLITEIQQELE